MENFKVTNPSSLDDKHVALGQVIDSMKARLGTETGPIFIASQIKVTPLLSESTIAELRNNAHTNYINNILTKIDNVLQKSTDFITSMLKELYEANQIYKKFNPANAIRDKLTQEFSQLRLTTAWKDIYEKIMSRIIMFSKKKNKDLLSKKTRLAKKAENANTKKEKANSPILKKDLNTIILDITTKIKKELTTGKQLNSKAPVVGNKIGMRHAVQSKW
jgi:hypothetical protein